MRLELISRHGRCQKLRKTLLWNKSNRESAIKGIRDYLYRLNVQSYIGVRKVRPCPRQRSLPGHYFLHNVDGYRWAISKTVRFNCDHRRTGNKFRSGYCWAWTDRRWPCLPIHLGEIGVQFSRLGEIDSILVNKIQFCGGISSYRLDLIVFWKGEEPALLHWKPQPFIGFPLKGGKY